MTTTEQLIATLAADATPRQPAPHPVALAAKWLLLAALYVALVLMVKGLRPDLVAKLQAPWFVAELLLLASVVTTTTFSAALLSFPDLHQKRHLAYGPLWALGAFALVVGLSWRADNPPAPLPVHSVECLLFIACATLLPAAWMFYSMRRLASTHPYTAGSIAVLCAFSIGALLLRLSEHTDSMVHVLQWHYLPMMGVAILGLGLGKLLLKW